MKKKMALIECPECGKKISDQAKMCPHCGMPLEKTIICPECGEEISSAEKNCPACGFPVKKNYRRKLWKKVIRAICFFTASSIIVATVIFGINYANNQKKAQLELESENSKTEEPVSKKVTASSAHNTTVDFKVLEKSEIDDGNDNQVVFKIQLTNNFKRAISRVNGILVISDTDGAELKRAYCRLENFDLMPNDVMEKNDFEVSLDTGRENDEKIYASDISELQFRFIVNEVVDGDGNIILPKTHPK